MNARRLGYLAAWLVATALATVASMTAVGLVGASATDSRSPLQTFASLASTTTVAPGAAEPSTGPTISLPPTSMPATTTSDGTSTTSIATTTSTVPASSSTTDATTATTTSTTIPSTTTSSPTTTTTLPTTGPFTFPVEGGSVTVSCLVDVVALDGAIPNGGFSVEIEKAGPEEVRVEFHADEIEIEVSIECEDGVAVLEVEESGS